MSRMAAPAQRALVAITAHYTPDVARHRALAEVVAAVQGWQIQTAIVLFSQNATALGSALRAAGARDSGVSLRNYRSAALVHPWMLAFAHRRLFEANLAKFDLFAYLEDDIELTWAHVVAWARDDAALARHSAATGARWSRGFYRLHRDDAGRMSRDDIFACEFNFSSWPCRIPPPAGGGGALGYVKLRNPYSAAWLMRRARLAALINSSQWRPRRPGASKHVLPGVPWSIRESAAAGDQFLHGAGYRGCGLGTAVVPYEMTAAGPRLAADAGVRHLVPAKPCGCKLDDLRKDVFVAQCLCDGAAATLAGRPAGCGVDDGGGARYTPMRRYSDVW